MLRPRDHEESARGLGLKCPDCGYENAGDAPCCNRCRTALRAPKDPLRASSPPPTRPRAGAASATQPTVEPAQLDSPAAVQTLLAHTFHVGNDVIRRGDEAALRGEVARLASRFFLELPPERCRKLVLEPTARDWLAVAVPALVSPERNAKAKSMLDAMMDAAASRRFGEAKALLQAADAAAGKHGWFELLILGLGLKRASEASEPQKGRVPAVAPAQPREERAARPLDREAGPVERAQTPAPPARRPPLRSGDLLDGRYEIHRVLGEGGFGIVYLAYHRPSGTAMALKTFRDELLHDEATRRMFRKEAQILVDLEPHPHLVRAYLVDEIHGRLFIGLEYVAPDDEGLNTLEGYLKRRPPDLAQSLRWAIQFCRGMEFAQAHGLRCHRDVKPANIMIDGRGRLLISDFGLAGAAQRPKAGKPEAGGGKDGRTSAGIAFGTATHMPPEQFEGAEHCDQRSDLYAFGVVLFQMAAGGRLPFWCDDHQSFSEGMRRLHATAPIPTLGSPLLPIVQRCLQKSPLARYQRFAQLRQDLEALLRKTTGEVPPLPETKRPEDADWEAKGLSLRALGRYQEALACFDRTLALSPTTQAWNNQGSVWARLSRWGEAVDCFDRAIAAGDKAQPWANRAAALLRMGRKEDALHSAEAALQRDPKSRGGWANKGACLHALRRHEEALLALGQALEIAPDSEDAWATKVAVLQALGRSEDALAAAEECLSINAGSAIGWTNKGFAVAGLGRHEEALACFEQALALDGALVNAWGGKRASCKALGRTNEVFAALERELELDPESGATWLDKGRELIEAKRWAESIECLQKAASLEPEWPLAWTNLGLCLMTLGRLDEAEAAYGKALALNPAHGTAALTRGDLLRKLARYQEAIGCFEAAIAAVPPLSAPQRGVAWYCKGDCLHRLGRLPEAAPCYEAALPLLPENARGLAVSAAEACRKRLPPQG